MERFIVSARKYRPQNFSTVVGQAHITTTLKNAIRNQQLAHAFLFCGPRGVGKTTCARILGKTINCENPSADGEACNQCNSCISFNEGTSLNIHELDAASNNSVDDIRTLVEQVRFAPQAGKYKVYIIDEVHMLSSSAFNAFLKTLEEPPPYAIFILATTEKYKILPTILSRCQIFDFKRITIPDTVDHLLDICRKEEIKTDKASLQVIAQKSEGCMRDALSILDKIVSFTNGEVTYQNVLEHLNVLDEDYYFKLMEALHTQKLADAMLLYDDINRKGFEGDLVLNGFAEFVRNLLVCKDEKAARLLEVVENFRERYISVSKNLDSAFLIGMLNILNEAEINYKAARNKRLQVELALIKLSYLQQAVELIDQGGIKAKKKLPDEAKPLAFRAIRPLSIPIRAADTLPEITKQPVPAESMLIISDLVSAEKKPEKPAASPESTAPSMGALSKIRQQFLNRQRVEEQQFTPLSDEKLKEAWYLFSQKLKENKNSAMQSFQRAQLRIISEHQFEVITFNNLEQKFIEQEKRNLIEFLKEFFHNKLLTFSVSIQEKAASGAETEKPMSKREQYQHIIEQYPLVKELRDRLKLELDY
jgi:DNA polymerase III subunit gamma/tau